MRGVSERVTAPFRRRPSAATASPAARPAIAPARPQNRGSRSPLPFSAPARGDSRRARGIWTPSGIVQRAAFRRRARNHRRARPTSDRRFGLCTRRETPPSDAHASCALQQRLQHGVRLLRAPNRVRQHASSASAGRAAAARTRESGSNRRASSVQLRGPASFEHVAALASGEIPLFERREKRRRLLLRPSRPSCRFQQLDPAGASRASVRFTRDLAELTLLVVAAQLVDRNSPSPIAFDASPPRLHDGERTRLEGPGTPVSSIGALCQRWRPASKKAAVGQEAADLEFGGWPRARSRLRHIFRSFSATRRSLRRTTTLLRSDRRCRGSTCALPRCAFDCHCRLASPVNGCRVTVADLDRRADAIPPPPTTRSSHTSSSCMPSTMTPLRAPVMRASTPPGVVLERR